jgi:uncharacterized membrane protein YoaK (UPF0700 family)
MARRGADRGGLGVTGQSSQTERVRDRRINGVYGLGFIVGAAALLQWYHWTFPWILIPNLMIVVGLCFVGAGVARQAMRWLPWKLVLILAALLLALSFLAGLWGLWDEKWLNWLALVLRWSAIGVWFGAWNERQRQVSPTRRKTFQW